jgi:putative transposase
MAFDPDHHRRRSIRLRDHDYRSAGAYFVTAVTANRDCLFADAPLRSIVERCWLAVPRHFAHVQLDAWVVMPNHVHGIVVIDTPPRAGPHHEAAAVSGAFIQPGSLAAIVGNFKSVSTRRINRARRTVGGPVWQRNYYERIVRHDGELDRIRAYIAANPARWALDRENPERGEVRDEWTDHEDLWFAPRPPSSPYGRGISLHPGSGAR